MADYYGLQAITQRMGMHRRTLLRLYDEQRFLMFRRWRKPGRRKARQVWYTNDELIARWETAQCHAQWRAGRKATLLARRGPALDAPRQSMEASGA